jgi:tyrosyl-tRNA synthetase
VVFVVGDFTAKIGDPEGKSKVRPEIEQAEVEKNAETYIAQIGKILRTDPAAFAWIRNSDWFTGVTDIFMPPGTEVKIETSGGQEIVVDGNSFPGKAAIFESTRMQRSISKEIRNISLITFMWTLRHITHSRLIERDMFQDRINKGAELYMHEMMYPVLQGIDSAMIARVYGSCDLEVGGTDQTFNMLMGRDIMKANNLEQQAVLSFEILPGLDGKEKMSKSLDNYVGITDKAEEMYGKIMSIRDESIPVFFRLATYAPLSEIEQIEKRLEAGKENPKDIKMSLARQIVSEYHGEASANKAEENFVETFSNKGVPEDMLVVEKEEGTKLVDALLDAGIIESKTEWRRLIEEGAVTRVDTDQKITKADEVLSEAMVLKVGKRRFIKLVVS